MKCLCLGCNHDQLPYLREIRKSGYTVIGTDLNSEAPGGDFCNVFHPNVSYSDTRELINLGQAYGFDPCDAVFTAASHHAYEGAAGFAAHFGIPFPPAAAIDCCLDKTKLYSVCEVLGIPYPVTLHIRDGICPPIDYTEAYWMKSDYGKSPKYCERIVFDGEGELSLPEKDQFYRQAMLLQREVQGAHIRLNLVKGQGVAFLVFADYSIQVPNDGVKYWDEIVEALCLLTHFLELDELLVKFDLILQNTGEWFLLDIGLDPPMRLKKLCEAHGYDFAKHYVAAYLRGIPFPPFPISPWEKICA